MKKRIVALLAAAVCALSFAACGTGTKTVTKEKDITYKYSEQAVRYAARANAMAKNVLNTYIDGNAYSADKNGDEWEVYLMGNYDPVSKQPGGVASVWHYTSVVAMTNRLAAVTDGSDKSYYLSYNSDLIKELDWYRGTGTITNYNGTHQETMYGVNRASRERNKATVEGDKAVYDDQMWLIREFIAAYKNTDNADYLEEAERLASVCLDGWNTSLKENGEEWGGITWGPYYSSFHTCSNAPIIKSLCDLAALYKDSSEKIGDQTKYEYYLNWAKKVYDFTYDNLKNAENTYGDNFGTQRETVASDNESEIHYETLSKGSVDPTVYTYNVGAMISGGAELYKLTGESRYLAEARASAEAADHAFATLTDKGVYNLPSTSTVWFNLVLLQGYMDLYESASEAGEYIEKYAGAFDYAYDNYYYNGFLPRNYVEGWVFGDNSFDSSINVMDSAANAEMYAMLSEYYAAKKA